MTATFTEKEEKMKLLTTTTTLLSLAWIFGYGTATAQEYHVSTVQEIQTALDASQNDPANDTILVEPKTYSLGRPLTYTSDEGMGSLTIKSADPGRQVILDAQRCCPILQIDTDHNHNYTGDEGVTIRLENISFHNGANDSGLYVKAGGASVFLKSLQFEGNSTEHSGGGAILDLAAGDVRVEQTIFRNNNAKYDGGGLYVSTDGKVILSASTFQNNSCERIGGGAYVANVNTSKEMTISHNLFSGNRAFNSGNFFAGGGGLFSFKKYGRATVNANRFLDNMAYSQFNTSWGGGAYFDRNALVTNNIFSDNTADNGGGALCYVYDLDDIVSFVNNTFLKNSGRNSGGGLQATLHSDDSLVEIGNNIFYNNYAPPLYQGDDLYVDADHNNNSTGGKVDLMHNIFETHTDFDTALSEDLFITQADHYVHSDNITGDPLLKSNGYLRRGSPAINAGICGKWVEYPGMRFYHRIAPVDDIDGDRRPGYGVVMGCDIGADEYKKFPWPMFLPALITPK